MFQPKPIRIYQWDGEWWVTYWTVPLHVWNTLKLGSFDVALRFALHVRATNVHCLSENESR